MHTFINIRNVLKTSQEEYLQLSNNTNNNWQSPTKQIKTLHINLKLKWVLGGLKITPVLHSDSLIKLNKLSASIKWDNMHKYTNAWKREFVPIAMMIFQPVQITATSFDYDQKLSSHNIAVLSLHGDYKQTEYLFLLTWMFE